VFLRTVGGASCLSAANSSREIEIAGYIFYYHFDIHPGENSGAVFISACLNTLFF